MSVLSTVTAKTLKQNRVRTTVTIIGIILSAAMFTAVTSIVSSFLSFYVRAEKFVSGNFHAGLLRCCGALVRSVSDDERVSLAAFAEYLGYAEIESKNEDKPYLCVLGANDIFFENMPVHLAEGRLPENESEIIIPEHLDYNGNVRYAVGEKLDFELGTRLVDGEARYQNSSYYSNSGAEKLSKERTAGYTVVGIYKRPDFEPYDAPGYTALTKMNTLSDEREYQLYFKVNSPKKNLDAVITDHGLDGIDAPSTLRMNTALLMTEGSIKNDSVSKVFIGLAAIVSALIFIGSVSLIYNAFSISVSERTRQFGILSSVGATRKQLRSSVLYEALILSGIGIPLGILAGLAGTGLTLYFLKDSFTALSTADSYQGGITLEVSFLAILAAALLSFITVLVSAWIPSRRAMRVSPMEAIRQSRDIKAKGKAPRTSKAFVKLFGAEGLLARNYYRRSRKKYRATVLSLALSLVLFISASSFSMYLTRTAAMTEEANGDSNYDLEYIGMELDEFEAVRSELESFTDEVSVITSLEGDAFFTAPNGYASEYQRKIERESGRTGVHFFPNAKYIYLDDTSFERLVKQYGLDMSAFTDPNEKAALIVNSCRNVTYENGEISTIATFPFIKPDTSEIMLTNALPYPKSGQMTSVIWSGDSFGSGDAIRYFTYLDREYAYDDSGRPIDAHEEKLVFERVKVGAILENAPVGVQRSHSDCIMLIFPMSTLQVEPNYLITAMRCDDPEQAAKQFKSMMSERGIVFHPSNLWNASDDSRMIRSIVTIINVFTYGFIVLITLISAANVFNTITTNVALRRRDYAMLRSVGMTKRGMNRMMNYECLLYGSRALIIGLPVSILFTYLIFKAVSGLAVMRFTLPYKAMAIAVVCVFAVVFASMLFQVSKLKKDDLLETLRNENI